LLFVDRLVLYPRHKYPIYVGQALCNAQYRFGLTSVGFFQWQDCISDETHVLYTGGERKLEYFEITETGTLQLFSSDEDLVWEKESTRDIHASKECRHNPLARLSLPSFAQEWRCRFELD
jgi:hypothetical protein